MLKRIQSSQIVTGMYIQELCGAWTEHPFWTSRFLVKSDKDIQRIIDSGIEEVVIDTDKGVDVAAAPDRHEEAERRAETTLLKAAESAARPQQASLEEELQQAARICARSKKAVMDMFQDARMGNAVSTDSLAPLVEEISDSVMRHPSALLSLARIKTSDEYTYMHSVAVCALMIALSRQLCQEEDAVHQAGMGGLMHDMGKAFIPLAILNKPDRLTDAEFDTIKTHPERGYQVLLESGEPSAIVLDVVRHHHEKVNGTGYPDKLPDQDISLFAKMGAVCDVYDAITSDRPYKRGWDPAEAIKKMAEWSKGHFDDKVFQAFVKTIGIYPTGSLVRLSSGRLAVVVEQNPAALLTPQVKVFYSTSARAHITPKLIDLSKPGQTEKIAGREDPEAWRFDNLGQLWSGMDDPRAGRED